MSADAKIRVLVRDKQAANMLAVASQGYDLVPQHTHSLLSTRLCLMEHIEDLGEAWTAFIGEGDTEGHDDPVRFGEALAEALDLVRDMRS